MLVAKHDYCNIGYTISKALNAAGCESTMYLQAHHRFGYPETGVYYNNPSELKEIARKADVIQFLHSEYVDLGISLSRKPVAVLHSGSWYRNYPDLVNDLFNPITRLTVIQTADLLGLGATNEFYRPGVVDTDLIQPDYRLNNPRIVAHFPSSAWKGSDIIQSVMAGKNAQFVSRDYRQTIMWPDNLNEMRKCDIYFDALCLELDKFHTGVMKVYGEWGIQTLEAAALGKIVITHSLLGQKIYREQYGNCALWIANDKETIAKHLERLLAMTDDELLAERKKVRAWVEAKHSPQAAGETLKQKYLEIL